METAGHRGGAHGAVTATTWQQPMHNRWAFWHIRELMPTMRVARDAGGPRPLPEASDPPDIPGVELVRSDGTRGTVRDVLDESYTDAWVVLQDGRLVAESYAEGGGPHQPHAVMSVTKSIVGCVAGVLAHRGQIDVTADLVTYVPELSDTGYAGATIRQLLDMRSGVRFVEDYTDPYSEVRQLDRWVGWAASRDERRGLYSFLTTLTAEASHGGPFRYRSSETDALGWACERASGTRMADLISTHLWSRIGTEQDAEMICDSVGTAIHNGGLSATARDLARFGQLLLDGGNVTGPAGEVDTVMPPHWLRHAWAVDSDIRAAFVESPSEQSFPGGWYRNQFWFRPGEQGDVLLCLGIYGQMVHVSRRTRTVCVKLSSWPTAQDPRLLQDTLWACDGVGAVLAGRERVDGPHRLPGVVAGLTRRGDASPPRGGSVV